MKNISLTAILVGLAIKAFLAKMMSRGIGIFVGLVVGSYLPQTSNWVKASEIDNFAMHPINLSMSLIATLFASIVSGYAAAYTARQDKLFNAVALGLVSLTFTMIGSIFLASFFTSYPLWYLGLLTLFVMPATILGGWLHVKFEKPPIQPPLQPTTILQPQVTAQQAHVAEPPIVIANPALTPEPKTQQAKTREKPAW